MSMRTHFICMLFRIHQFECIIFLKETLKFHAHENKWLHCKQNTDEKLISVNSLSTKKTVTTFKQEIKRQFFLFQIKITKCLICVNSRQQGKLWNLQDIDYSNTYSKTGCALDPRPQNSYATRILCYLTHLHSATHLESDVSYLWHKSDMYTKVLFYKFIKVMK